jgi:hypothetical protein
MYPTTYQKVPPGWIGEEIALLPLQRGQNNEAVVWDASCSITQQASMLWAFLGFGQ